MRFLNGIAYRSTKSNKQNMDFKQGPEPQSNFVANSGYS
jgi:hypothetical protein